MLDIIIHEISDYQASLLGTYGLYALVSSLSTGIRIIFIVKKVF